MLVALASPPATKALDPDPFPCRSLRHVIYAALLHFGLETANILKPHRKQQWVITPDASAAFVADMEDVLEVYQRPHDPQRPLVCLDETSKQLIIETRAPIPAKPGRKARHDYEYERNGVANLFMVFAPLEGWRLVKVTDRHTAIDYAHMLRDLSDVHFPDAAKIVLVQDNLNTHKPASLYEAFPAAEARRLVERFGRVSRRDCTSGFSQNSA